MIIENIYHKYEKGDYSLVLIKKPIKEEFVENLDETVRLNNQRRDEIGEKYKKELKLYIQERQKLHNKFISDLCLTEEVSALKLSENTVAKIWRYVLSNFDRSHIEGLFDEFENILELFNSNKITEE